MPVSSSFLLDLGIILVFIFVLSVLFAKLKLPVIPAQILAGMIAGPYVLGWVQDTTTINDLSTIGIILLLFVIGLELEPTKMINIARKSIGMFGIEVPISFALGMAAVLLFGGTWMETIVFALAMSITSTAIVGRLIMKLKARDETETNTLMGVLVIEDLFAVLALVVISSIGPNGAFSTSRPIVQFLFTIAGGLVLAVVGYLVATYVAPKVIDYINSFELEYDEIPFLFSLGLGFAFAIIAQLFGYSPGIGAFVIGLALRGKFSEYVKSKIGSIKELFILIFFFSMGIKIDPYPAFSIGLIILPVVLLALLGKYIGGVVTSGIFLKSHGSDRSRIGMWLMPRGEFSFVIGQLALGLGLITVTFYSLIGMMVIVTALVGPIFLKILPRGSKYNHRDDTASE